jgi:rhamnogalacturonyl hydrolase YesR
MAGKSLVTGKKKYLIALWVLRLDTQKLVTLTAEGVDTLLQALRTRDTGLLYTRIFPHAIWQDALCHSSIRNPYTALLHHHTPQTTLQQQWSIYI